MNYTRTVSFTSATNLLSNSNVKAAIKQCLGLDDTAYAARLAENPVTKEKMGFRMKIDVICDSSANLVINGQTQNLVAGVAYSSDYAVDIYSLELSSAASGTISMDIRR